MAPLVLYDFTGQAASTNGNPPATSVATDVTASALAKGAGLSGLEVYTTGSYATAPTLRIASVATSTSTTTITQAAYWEFTVTPASGKSLTLSGLALKAARGGASTPRGFEVRTSLDGFSTNVVAPTDVPTVRPTLTSYSYDWSGLTVPANTALTVRVYIYNGTAGATLEFDDITLTGDVVSNVRAGTVTGNTAWTGALTGRRQPKGTATGNTAWVAALAGKRNPAGTVTGALTWTTAIVGRRAPAGAVTGNLTWVGSLTGKRLPKGVATGSTAWTGVITGTAPAVAQPAVGTVVGTTTWTGSVTGTRRPVGTVAATTTWSGTLAGKRRPVGLIVGSTEWATEILGRREPAGLVTGETTWVGVLTGSETEQGRDIVVVFSGPFYRPSGITGPMFHRVDVVGPNYYPLQIVGPLEHTE